MLRLDEDLHTSGENTPVREWLTMQALSWWIAAELVRRHPGKLYPYLTGGDFQYDCLAVGRLEVETDRPPRPLIVTMNRQPHGHLTHGSWFGQQEATERFNWLEVLLSTDRLTYVIEQLEREAGLDSPAKAPATTASTVGTRAISAFLNRSMLSKKSWVAVCGTWEGGQGEAGFNDGWFDAMPGMTRLSPSRTVPKGPIPRTEYRYWFLCPTVASSGPSEMQPRVSDPTTGLDVLNGLCWSKGNGEPIDMMKRYEKVGRSIDALVSDAFPAAF